MHTVLGSAVLLLLWGLHGYLCLQWFGAKPLEHLLSHEPIIIGQHALHYYHGLLGAKAFGDQSSTLVYDPGFQAGSIKSPWFDSESKPVEALFKLVGTTFAPQAYKWMVLALWWLLPMCGCLAAALLGQGWGTRLLALAYGFLLLWSDFGLERMWQGDLATLWVAGGLLIWAAALTRLFTQPCWLTWLFWFLVQTSLLFIQPFALLFILPTLLMFYLRVGWQRSGSWHLAFGVGFCLAIMLNFPWFRDAFRSGWMLSETPQDVGKPALYSMLDWPTHILALGWFNLFLAACLLIGGGVGLSAMRRLLPSGATRSLLTLWLLLLLVAWVGPLWETLARLDPSRWFFAALLLGTLPCARLTRSLTEGLSQASCQSRWLGLASLIMLLTLLAMACYFMWPRNQNWRWSVQPLPIGLPRDVLDLVQVIRQETDGQARILWEEDEEDDAWSPLLAHVTERFWMGGLSPRIVIDHLQQRMSEGMLVGKPLTDWTVQEWEHWVRQYNIGWIVVRSPATLTQLRSLASIQMEKRLPHGRVLVTLQRQPTYFLKGQGRVLSVDSQRITLTDIEPEGGEIILSMHYLARIRSTNARARVERSWQMGDAVPFIRIGMVGPMTRLTLFWQD